VIALPIIIVDDEALARERICTLLRSEDNVEIVAECANCAEALEAIRTHPRSLVFLDVQMPALDGFAVLGALAPHERPPAIVFVTAYDRYAVQAFDVNAIDYLLKPYTHERFRAALDRARATFARPPSTNQQTIDALLRAMRERSAVPERIAIKSKESVQFVRTAEIDWLQADGNYTQVHVGSHAIRTRETLTDLAEKLSAAGFVRVHRALLVNTDRILRLEPWTHGEYVIVLRNGTKLNSGRSYGEQIRRLLA
jgi:two-component system, LytTR family, response regulator